MMYERLKHQQDERSSFVRAEKQVMLPCVITFGRGTLQNQRKPLQDLT